MPYYGYYGFDYTYVLLVMPAFLLALWAQYKVKSTYAEYSRTSSMAGYTAEEVVRRMLDSNGLYSVAIERVSGELTDHYDPAGKVIRLSETVYGHSSIAALGVAAHEAGHAIQHKEGYAPLALRNTMVKVTGIGSQLAIPLFFLGLFLQLPLLTGIGIVLFSLVTVFQLITLPVEFNASKRALATLGSKGILGSSELPGAKKVLSAAALTYVAALVMSLAQLLRLIALANRRRR